MAATDGQVPNRSGIVGWKDIAKHLGRSDGLRPMKDTAGGSSHDRGVGGLHVDVVDAVFDVAIPLASAVQCEGLSASVCVRPVRWISSGLSPAGPSRFCITYNDTDKLSDPWDGAGSESRAGFLLPLLTGSAVRAAKNAAREQRLHGR